MANQLPHNGPKQPNLQRPGMRHSNRHRLPSPHHPLLVGRAGRARQPPSSPSRTAARRFMQSVSSISRAPRPGARARLCDQTQPQHAHGWQCRFLRQRLHCTRQLTLGHYSCPPWLARRKKTLKRTGLGVLLYFYLDYQKSPNLRNFAPWMCIVTQGP